MLVDVGPPATLSPSCQEDSNSSESEPDEDVSRSNICEEDAEKGVAIILCNIWSNLTTWH